MQVVVTGGAGFIGSRVVERLLKRGDRVTVLDIATWDPPPAAGSLEVLKGSVLDPDAVQAALSGAEAVIHLAGPVRSGMNRQPYLSACLQLQGTLNVLQACQAGRVPRLCYASSFYVYDGLPAELTVDESTRLDPTVMEFFGSAKFMGELLCAEYARRGGPAVVAFRIGPAYGGQGSSAIDTFVESGLRTGTVEVWGSGERRNQYTYVADVADAIVAGLDHGSGLYNLVAPEPVRLRELADLLKEYRIEATFDASRPEGPCLPYIRSDRAAADLGWTPRSVAVGVQELIAAHARAGS